MSLSRLLQSPEALSEPLLAQMEEGLGAHLSFQETRIIFTPFPLLQVKKPRLEPVDEWGSAWEAEEARFSFRFWPLLLGQVRLAGFRVREGEGTFWGLALEGVEFEVKRFAPKKFVPFKGKARGAGGKEIFKGEGRFNFQNRGEDFWRNLKLQAELTWGSLSLSDGIGKEFSKRFPLASLSGEGEGLLHLEKERGKDEMEGRARFQIKNFQSPPSGASPLTGEAKLGWNPKRGRVELKEASFHAPFGEVGGSGIFHVERGEIEEARLKGRKVVLEELVRFFPHLDSILPLNVGFSGESDFDLSFRGGWDYLSLHANWNLTPAVLSYGKIFSKPKDFPLGVNWDLLLKGRTHLSGDFSARLSQMTLKGVLVHFDLKSGAGELTLLTNKFDLKGWEALLPPFSRYEISGAAKFLLNYKGNLIQRDPAQKVLNLTLENVSLRTPSGRGVRVEKLLLDMSPLSFQLKEALFEVGDSFIELKAQIYNPSELPQGTIEVSSPRLALSEGWEDFKEFDLFFLPEKIKSLGAPLEGGLNLFFPKQVFLEAFRLRLRADPEKWSLDDLRFQALAGDFHFRGETARVSENPNFWLEASIERMNLARYFEAKDPTEKIFEGNFFLQGRFVGKGTSPKEWAEGLSGQGTLLVTNGEWHALDLLGPLAALAPFRGKLDPAGRPYFSPSDSAPFYDLKASWSYAEGKFETEDFLLRSEELWVEGEGNLSREGILNSRLEIYLSKFLTEQVLASWEREETPPGKQLGPIPFLLVGSLKKPELKGDEHLLPPFLEAIRARRFRRILHEPFLAEPS